MINESLKKAILNEVKGDYATYSRITKVFEVAEQAEKEAKDKIEQEELAKQDSKPSLADFAEKNRIIKD